MILHIGLFCGPNENCAYKVRPFLALPREQRSKGCMVENEATGARPGERLYSFLPRVQFDDQLFVNDRLHLVARGNVRDFAFQGITIHREPIRDWHNLRELEIAQDKLTRFRFVFDRDLVARFHIVRSDIDAATVHEDVPMRNELARGTARVRQAKPEDDIVDPRFEKLKKRLARDAPLAQRILKNAAELALEQSILITQLLFLTQRDCVIGLLAPRTFRAMHARWIIFSLERFRRPKEWHAVTSADFRFRSGVSAHKSRC